MFLFILLFYKCRCRFFQYSEILSNLKIVFYILVVTHLNYNTFLLIYCQISIQGEGRLIRCIISTKMTSKEKSHISLICRIFIIYFFIWKMQTFFRSDQSPNFYFILNSTRKIRLINNKYCALLKYKCFK